MSSFPVLLSLPLEIRRKSWLHALPGLRVLYTMQKAGYPREISGFGGLCRFTADPIPSASSYGGHHPAILPVNRESRVEALRYLRPLHGAYWNLEIDTPYIELPGGDHSRNEGI